MKIRNVIGLTVAMGLFVSAFGVFLQAQQARAQVNCYRNSAGLCIGCPSGTTPNGAGGCRPKTTTKPSTPDPLRLKEERKQHARDVANQQKQRGQSTTTNTTQQVAQEDNNGQTAPTQTGSTGYPGSTVAGPRGPWATPPEGVKQIEPKKGNIIVITYLDQSRKDSKGNVDKRLGLVNVKVEKAEGSAKCSNRKKAGAMTNGKRYLERDGKKVEVNDKAVIIKGSANWRNCNVGKYKVTAVGRDGYKIKGDATIEINLTEDETQVVKFVLTKNKTDKKKKSNSKKTSQVLYTGTRRS